MKTLFNFVLLILITSITCRAQEKILNKVLPTTGISKLALELQNAYVYIESSPDDKIYIDYSIKFNNYSVEDFKDIISGVNTDLRTEKDTYLLKVSSEFAMSSVVYSLDSPFGISLDNAFFSTTSSNTSKTKANRKHRISKKEMIASLRGEKDSNTDFLKSLERYNEDGSKEPVNLKKEKSYSVSFVIKVPEALSLDLKLIESEIFFTYNVKQQIECTAEDSTINGHIFENTNSTFRLDDGNFKAHGINGGRYMFNDVSKVSVASMENVNIESEFSEFKIAEINANVRISDFNSQFWIHNLSASLGDFVMDTEYSKINIFYPEDKKDYLLKTFGYGTVHYVNGIKSVTRPSRDKKSSTMLVIGNQEDKAANTITLNAINGIVRVGEDFIDIEN